MKNLINKIYLIILIITLIFASIYSNTELMAATIVLLFIYILFNPKNLN